MTYGRYQPNQYQAEAFQWARRASLQIADSIEVLQETYMEVIGEAGPNWANCPFVAETLSSINQDLRLAYQQCNNTWATGYSKGCNS